MLFSPINAYAADSYSVMYPDGNVVEVEDESITGIIDKITEIDGQEAADAYVEAMKTGDYTDFYEVVGDNTKTDSRTDYMPDGNMIDVPLNDPQSLEDYTQTILGPTGTVELLGKALQEAGFEQTVLGAQNYFIAIVMEEADRPSYAKDPVYKQSELRLNPRTMEDAELINEGIIVEYEDEPLTDFQKELAASFGYEIKSAAEIYGDEVPEVEEPEEVVEEEKVLETPVELPAEEAPADNISFGQFAIIAIIVIAAGVIVAAVAYMISRRKK